ncbi:MAG TPA: hypothetical protein P5137_00250 [Candidatus Brocadiia bacterium]|nr:hypothetical protein [Candidatus Brocadiia bacterium]
MRDLVILGVGVHAAEMAELVERINRVSPAYRLLGFLADEPRRHMVGRDLNGYPVLGLSDQTSAYPGAAFAFSQEFQDPVELESEQWASLVDPSAVVSRAAKVGRGCILFAHVWVGLNARLGERVFVLPGCVISHDANVEDEVAMASGVTLAGGVRVGPGCFLGQSCTVRQNINVGKGSLIGMGAVVVDDVPPNSVMAGNPARRMRDRFPE